MDRIILTACQLRFTGGQSIDETFDMESFLASYCAQLIRGEVDETSAHGRLTAVLVRMANAITTQNKNWLVVKELYPQAISLYRLTLGLFAYETLVAMQVFGMLLLKQYADPASSKWFRISTIGFARTLGFAHPMSVSAMTRWADSQALVGRYHEAVRAYTAIACILIKHTSPSFTRIHFERFKNILFEKIAFVCTAQLENEQLLMASLFTVYVGLLEDPGADMMELICNSFAIDPMPILPPVA